jgi:hypothetical protein
VHQGDGGGAFADRGSDPFDRSPATPPAESFPGGVAASWANRIDDGKMLLMKGAAHRERYSAGTHRGPAGPGAGEDIRNEAVARTVPQATALAVIWIRHDIALRSAENIDRGAVRYLRHH